MAEPLKNKFDIDVAVNIGNSLALVDPNFDKQGFVECCQQGYEQLELMPRARKIAQGLNQFLPDEYPEAIQMLTDSLPHLLEIMANIEPHSMSSFVYQPHVFYVADTGIDYFQPSMQALYKLTKLFTSEFGVRPFIQKYPEQSLALLTQWASDPNMHVRRLVSEGTRPRLPWASTLPEFIDDPQPVIELLELLKDDNELYVRRSVANNLNDISKDNLDVLVPLAKRWLKGVSEDRQWIIKHALRSAIKRAEPEALRVLGYGEKPKVKVTDISISPVLLKIGESVKISFDLTSYAAKNSSLMVDFAIHFVKASGESKPKVFKLKAIEMAKGEVHTFSKKVSLKPMSTRQHYPGVHKIDALINGQSVALGEFVLK